MKRQEHSNDGSYGQAQATGTLERRGAVTQLSVAARLGHFVSGGVGVAAGKINGCGLVAISLREASLH